MKSQALYWFRKDLRLHDNELLYRVEQDAAEVSFVYIFDPREFASSSYGFSRTGPHRLRCLRESLQALQKSLRSKGAELYFAVGDPTELIPQWVSSGEYNHVFFQNLVTHEEVELEQRLAKSLSRLNCKLTQAWTHTLYRPEDLPEKISDIPRVFSAFRRKIEKAAHMRPRFSDPIKNWPRSKSLPGGRTDWRSIDKVYGSGCDESPFSLIHWKGGEAAGLQRLNSFFWESDQVRSYKQTRNQLIGLDYSSKFSAWLANGSLSARHIAHELSRYEREREKNESTYWMFFELLWREYFQWVAFRYGAQLFQLEGPKQAAFKFQENADFLQAWVEGRTGIPFVDANMRELAETGYMSNRGRQNVASFLVNELNLDWRAGAEYFESQLIDYDPASNWGNWAYLAGVGQDPRDRRAFNILKQAQQYDPDHEFVSYWIPILRQLPPAWVHQPHLIPGATDRVAENTGLDLYFHPIVSLKPWVRRPLRLASEVQGATPQLKKA